MPEPLKNLYNEEFILSLCHRLTASYQKFDSKIFTQKIFNDEWQDKELKERMRHITENLHQFLPDDYRETLKILKSTSQHFSGFEPMFFPDFVEQYGLDEYTLSISALEHFTKYSSSEFAVRPFIQKYPKKMMKQMKKWARSNNHHVRRLASEGCRPRLPWAMALPDFKKNPNPVIEILELLKNDSSEYVRRSVANNLNDISKDNPEIVIQIAKRWIGDHFNTDRIVKHACRSLLKSGEPQTMKLFGFKKPNHIAIEKLKLQKTVTMGGNLKFSFVVRSKKRKLGKLRIEYAIDFMKKNGKQRRKVFMISEVDRLEREKEIVKEYSFKPISTRKYYPGCHRVVIVINGQELAQKKFQLAK